MLVEYYHTMHAGRHEQATGCKVHCARSRGMPSSPTPLLSSVAVVLPGVQDAVLCWRDLTVSATDLKGNQRNLLNGVCGIVKPMHLLAVMGPSGDVLGCQSRVSPSAMVYASHATFHCLTAGCMHHNSHKAFRAWSYAHSVLLPILSLLADSGPTSHLNSLLGTTNPTTTCPIRTYTLQ